MSHPAGTRPEHRPGTGAALWWLWLPLMLVGATPAAAAENAPADVPFGSWFYTEVVVFQRPAVLEHMGEEDLVREPLRGLPLTLRTFAAPGTLDARSLDPITRLCLTFPYLDHAALTRLDGVPDDGYWSDAARPPALPPPDIHPRLEDDPLLDYLADLAEFETDLESRSYRWLEPGTHTLTAEAQRLQRNAGYRILLHGRWLQPVPPRESPEPLLVQSGPRYGDLAGLEGTFDVTLGRYLHFQARLYYREPLMGQAPRDLPLAPPGMEPAASMPPLTEQDLTPGGFMQLRESRRMRSGELHYLDHPKLGVLVRIEPVILPDSLSAAAKALEEDLQ